MVSGSVLQEIKHGIKQNVDLCDICEIRGRTNHAIKWCPECEEKLCDDCYGNHSATKLSRDHGVIEIEQYRKLPKSILGDKNICEKHGMKFTYLCSQHDVLCCPACTSGSGDHIKCTTKILQDVIQTAKTSVLLQSVDENLKNVKENLMTIIDDRKLNLKKLQDQTIEILKEVKQIKEKIQEHLNQFEKNILDELNNTIYNNNSKIETEIASHGEKLQQAETLFKEAHSIKEYGSDLQVFMGSRLVENKVNKLNNYFQELVKNGNMKQVDVSLKWSKTVNEICDVMFSLGSIFEEETAVLVALAPDKRIIQVQVIQSNMSIEDIDITQIAKFDIIGKNLRGCIVFPNGKMIFADNKSKNLTLIKENGEMDFLLASHRYSYKTQWKCEPSGAPGSWSRSNDV